MQKLEYQHKFLVKFGNVIIECSQRIANMLAPGMHYDNALFLPGEYLPSAFIVGNINKGPLEHSMLIHALTENGHV